MPGVAGGILRKIFILTVCSWLVGCGSLREQPSKQPDVQSKPEQTQQEQTEDLAKGQTPSATEVVPAKPVCPEPQVITKPAVCPKAPECPRTVATGDSTNGLRLVGAVEYVDVLSIPMRKKARIDTGAKTSSIDASNIVEFERDGDKWVRFTVEDRISGEKTDVKAKVARTVLIKRHGVDSVRRWVVIMTLRMGKIQDTIEVNLADRDDYDFPLLIGRNFLDGRAVVDVSRKYLTLE